MLRSAGGHGCRVHHQRRSGSALPVARGKPGARRHRVVGARQGARWLARRGPFLRNGAALRTETLCTSLLGVLLFLPVTR